MRDSENSKHQNESEVVKFLSKDSTIAVACGSAYTAILAAIVRVAIYYYNRSYFNYWKIEPIYASQTSSELFYSTVIGSIFILLLFFFQSMLFQEFLEYEVRRYANKIRKRSTLKKQSSKQEKKNDNTTNAENKELRKNRMGFLLVVFMFSIAILIFLLTFSLVALFRDLNIPDAMFWALLIAVLDIVITFFVSKIKFAFSRKMKADVLRQDSLREKLTLSKAFSSNIKSIIAGIKLSKVVVVTIAASAILIIVMQGLGEVSAALKHDFQIYTENEEIYAVVYNDGERIIIQNAVENQYGNNRILGRDFENVATIQVDTSSYRVLPIDDIVLERRSYAFVERE